MEKYGIFDAPAAVRMTRNAKVEAISKLRLVKMAIDSLESRMERIPELNDTEHSLLVLELTEKILNACDVMWDCTR